MTVVARAQFGRTLDVSTSGVDKATLFYDMTAPYLDAVPLLESSNAYAICAQGVRIGVVRARPDSGLTAGVLTSVRLNHKMGVALSKFMNRCAAGHQLTDLRVLIRRFHNGIPDTLTENLTGDTTVVRGWITLAGLSGNPHLTDREYSNSWTAMIAANRSSDLTKFFRSQKTFPRIEFLDSLEVWIGSAAGSVFNDNGGVLGMQNIPSQWVYHSIGAMLMPRSSLYGRRVAIQAREVVPRAYDCAILGYTRTGGKKGFVWFTSIATGPCFTIATNRPWNAGSPFAINQKKFPDDANGFAQLEEDGAFYIGAAGRGGTPIFTTLHGSFSSGEDTIRIAKNEALTLRDYFPLRFEDGQHRWNYFMFNIRQSADPNDGGGSFAAFEDQIADCTTYWRVPLSNSGITEEVTGATLNANYDNGDVVQIVSNDKTIGTGTEDLSFVGENGYYGEGSLADANWQALLGNMYTDITADSVLWKLVGDSNNIGVKAPGYSAVRIWSPSGDDPMTLQFRRGEVCSYASFKYKSAHGGSGQGTLTRKIRATTVYVTEDGDFNYVADTLARDTLYARLAAAIDNSSGTVNDTDMPAEWDTLARPSRSSAGGPLDSLGNVVWDTTGARADDGLLDWQLITLDYNTTGTTGAVSTSRLFFTFRTDTITWNRDGEHRDILRAYLEFNATGAAWNSTWMASDSFPVDSSYLDVVRFREQADTVRNISLRFLGNDSLGGVKFSMYDYPAGTFGRIRVELPDSILKQGRPLYLATRLGTYDVRRVRPQLDYETDASIVRLDVADHSHADVNLRPRLIIESDWVAGIVADTQNVYFTDDRSGSDFIKDAFVIDGGGTTQSGSVQVRFDTNTNGTRNRKGMLSFTQAGRDSLRGKTIVSAICSVYVNSITTLAGDQLKLFVIADNDSSVKWPTTIGEVSALKREITLNLNWPGGRTTGPTTFATPFATYTIDSLVANNWYTFDVTYAVQSMCSTQVADSLRDGILWELTDDNDGTAGNIRFAAEEDGSTDAGTARFTDNARLDARLWIRYLKP